MTGDTLETVATELQEFETWCAECMPSTRLVFNAGETGGTFATKKVEDLYRAFCAGRDRGRVSVEEVEAELQRVRAWRWGWLTRVKADVEEFEIKET